jgi:hypothetical protein
MHVYSRILEERGQSMAMIYENMQEKKKKVN